MLLMLFLVNPFVRGVRVPLLGWIDLAIHEFGHVAFFWAPTDVMLVMGNGTQALLPLLLAGVFLLRERDLLGGALCIGWSATSLADAAVYIADAPWRMLPLLGPESSHDWWQLLGSRGMLSSAPALASGVKGMGFALLLLAAAMVAAGPWFDDQVKERGIGALWGHGRHIGPPIPIAPTTPEVARRLATDAPSTADALRSLSATATATRVTPPVPSHDDYFISIAPRP